MRDRVEHYATIPPDSSKEYFGKENVRSDKMQTLREAELEAKLAKRYKYARTFVRLATTWLFVVAAMLTATGVQSIPFELSDTVLIAVLGTALANVLAPVYLVAKYLFSNDISRGNG